jgi:hypothetical protein
MHALARRLVRPALTLELAFLAVGTVTLWGDPRSARSFAAFVAVSAVAVAVAALVRPPRRH